MGAMQPIHWILVLIVIAVLFGGRGKLSSIMGDAAKGVRAFKDGLKTGDGEGDGNGNGKTPPSKPVTRIEDGEEPR